MKKAFRPSPFLIIAGRSITILFIAFEVFISCLVFFVWREPKIEMVIPTIGLIIVFVVGFSAIRDLWQPIWGKLILTENAVIWRCAFCKEVKIPYTDIRYVERRMLQQNFFHGKEKHFYLLISSHPLPQEHLFKIRSKKNLIKFQYTPKVAVALKEFVPEPYEKRFKNLMLL